MCGGGLASSTVHVKFTTTSAHTLLFEVVMFTFKVTFSGLSAQKENHNKEKLMNSTLKVFFWGGINVSQFPPLPILLLLLLFFLFFYIITYAHVCSCERLIYTTN